MQVVYGDVLFLINFCMDLISLYVSGRIVSVRASTLGLLLASALGGAYGVASVFLPGLHVISLAIGVGVSFLMCFICYGSRCGRKNFLKAVAVMYICSLLLGGVITFAYSFLGRILPEFLKFVGDDPEGERKTLLFLAVAGLCSIVLLIARRVLAFQSQIEGISVSVTVDGRTGSFSALVDSGNLLTDPISGRKVIIAGISRLEGVLPAEVVEVVKSRDVSRLERLTYKNVKRIRIIPSRGVGSGRLLVGYLPDRIEISSGGDRAERYTVDAIIAFDGDSSADFGGYEAIVPSSLVA